MRRLVPIVIVVLALLGLLAAPAGATLTASLRAGTEVEALAVGSEGDLWFAGTNTGSEPGTIVGKIAPGGAVSEYLVPGSAAAPGVGGLARGPEGLLWFTRPGAERIERFGATGDFEGFGLPTAGSRPTGIVTVPGGFLWVAMEGTGRLAQVDPSGLIREFSLAEGTRPTRLAFGSDSALWGIEAESAVMVRGSLAGATAKYPLPTNGGIFRGAINSDIVAGHDGDLWLSQEDGPYVGRVKPEGGGSPEYTRFPVYGSSGTTLISTGPHADVWFANEAGEIGSISPTGRLGLPACAIKNCNLGVQALTEGPEGELWFAAGEKIGTFTPPPISASFKGHLAKVKGRDTSIKVRCSGGAAAQRCSGRVEVVPRGKGKALARASFRGTVQQTTTVKLKLTKAAKRLLDGSGTLPVRVLLFRNGNASGGAHSSLGTAG
jgi:virginiamycin B lyase